MKINSNMTRKMFAVLLLLLPLNSFAISRAVERLVHNEVLANDTKFYVQRSVEPVQIQNFLIPLTLLNQFDIASRISPELAKSLLEKHHDGIYVRWLINPEDTVYAEQLEKYLIDNGLSAKRYNNFVGYMTASRSYIIQDPTTGAEFSAKVSTNHTPGHWADKGLSATASRKARLIGDYLNEVAMTKPFKYLVVLDEPAAFGIDAIKQGMIVRSLGSLPNSKMTYLPGFSALSSQLGAEIAKINGSDSPADFWQKNYVEPVGRALGELAARTGLTYNSPHSQNFLVELDENMRPTGRIVIRDFADSFLFAPFFEAIGRKNMLIVMGNEQVKNELDFSTALFNGMEHPVWRSYWGSSEWQGKATEAFEKEFTLLTGVPIKNFGGSLNIRQNFVGKKYSANDASWKPFFQHLKDQTSNTAGLRCENVFW